MDAGFPDCQGLFLHLLVTAPWLLFYRVTPQLMRFGWGCLHRGRRNDSAVQYSAWIRRTEDLVHRVAKSWTQLKQLSTCVSHWIQGWACEQAWLIHCLALVTGRVQSHNLSWSNQSLPLGSLLAKPGRDLSCCNSCCEGRIKS